MVLNDDCQDVVEEEEEVTPPDGGGSDNPKKLLWLYVAPLSSLILGGVSVSPTDYFSIRDIPWATASTPGEFLEPDPESDSFYTETYNDETDVITQKASIVIKGVRAVKLRAIRELSNYCALAVIVVYESKESILQGVDHYFLGFNQAKLIHALVPATITNVVTTSASSTDSSTISMDIVSVVRQYGSRISNYQTIVS